MNSATARMVNREAVQAFGRHWDAAGKFDWIGRSIAIFPCNVTYHMKGRTRHVETTTSITHDGKIELYENNWLNVDDHYTGFEVAWQQYSFTDEFALRVEGDGEKVNGRYWVEIVPI